MLFVTGEYPPLVGGVGRFTAELAQALHSGLGLRAAVAAVPAGTLPRFELKARRVTDHRANDG